MDAKRLAKCVMWELMRIYIYTHHKPYELFSSIQKKHTPLEHMVIIYIYIYICFTRFVPQKLPCINHHMTFTSSKHMAGNLKLPCIKHLINMAGNLKLPCIKHQMIFTSSKHMAGSLSFQLHVALLQAELRSLPWSLPWSGL